MGTQARRRRARRAQDPNPAPPDTARPRPWWHDPWKAGAAGALLFGGSALVRVLLGGHGAPTTSSAPDAAVARIAEREPNDHPEAAQPMPPSAEVTAHYEAGDVDHYLLAVTESGGHVLHVTIDGDPPPPLRLSVVRDKKTLVSGAARVRALGVVAGEYLITVDADATAATGDYRLRVGTTPWAAGLDWEPNNDPDHAQPLYAQSPRAQDAPAGVGTGEPVIGHVTGAGWWTAVDDVDCYFVPLSVPPAGAVLRIVLTPPANVMARLWVIDEGDRAAGVPPRRLAEARSAAPGKAVVLPALGARSWEARYTVCSQPLDGTVVSAAADVPYRLEVVTFTPTGAFEFEPNDTRATASALPRQATLAGYLPDGDVDVYRLSAGTSELVVTLVPPAGVAGLVQLLGEDGAVKDEARGTAGETVRLLGGGAAFVVVRAVGSGSTDARYTLTTTALSPSEPPR